MLDIRRLLYWHPRQWRERPVGFAFRQLCSLRNASVPDHVAGWPQNRRQTVVLGKIMPLPRTKQQSFSSMSVAQAQWQLFLLLLLLLLLQFIIQPIKARCDFTLVYLLRLFLCSRWSYAFYCTICFGLSSSATPSKWFIQFCVHLIYFAVILF
jgi:hypothetical protein